MSKKTEASNNRKITKKALAKNKKKVITVKKKNTALTKLKITAPRIMKPRQKRADITLNTPTTAEQKAGIPAVVSGNSFEGVRDLSSLDFEAQMDTIFNPLHSVTKTTVSDAVSDATYIVPPTPPTQG